MLDELIVHLPNCWAGIEDFDGNSMTFIVTGVEEVSGTAPNLANELHVLVSDNLLESIHAFCPRILYKP
jgi:hypothetical protein